MMTAKEYVENVLGSTMDEMAEAQEMHEMEEQERFRAEQQRESQRIAGKA